MNIKINSMENPKKQTELDAFISEMEAKRRAYEIHRARRRKIFQRNSNK